MQFTASQIALMIQGKLEGDATTAISSFGKIEEAVTGQLSFLAKDNTSRNPMSSIQ